MAGSQHVNFVVINDCGEYLYTSNSGHGSNYKKHWTSNIDCAEVFNNILFKRKKIELSGIYHKIPAREERKVFLCMGMD